MPGKSKNLPRREFLKSAGIVSTIAFGVLAFPPGLSEVVEALGPAILQVTRNYPRLRVARLPDVTDGKLLDFSYPLKEHTNFLVKLGIPAWDGVGPDKDIVAFNYLCAHMGCPLNGQYRHEFKMLGPCPCHFSQYDLAKNGTLILGQATQSLPQILLEVQADEIYAVAFRGLVYGFWNNLPDGVQAP